MTIRWLLACAICAGVLGIAGCDMLPFGGDPVAEPAVSVVAERGRLTLRVPAVGELESLQASAIAVPRVPTGALKVKELVPEGTIVEPGEVVIVFDETELEIELGNHRASFRSADRRIDRTGYDASIESRQLEVMKEVAELTRDNAEAFAIVDDEIYSELEILETEVERDEAVQTIRFAEASLLLRGEYFDIEERILQVEKDQVAGKIGRVETSLANLVLKTPIGGLVVYKKNWRGGAVAVGDSLWPGNVVMSIVDPKSVALQAFVLEKDAAGIEAGLAADVRIDAVPEATLAGEVIKVAKIPRPIEQQSPVKYFEVTIRVDAGEVPGLVPGMKGEAWIRTAELEDVVIVPRSAVRGNPEQHYVWIAGDAAGERRPVELGPGDQVRVSVTEGLGGGEPLLLGGEPNAESEGSDVAVARPSAETPSGQAR